jgi:hypothetical protein
VAAVRATHSSTAQHGSVTIPRPRRFLVDAGGGGTPRVRRRVSQSCLTQYCMEPSACRTMTRSRTQRCRITGACRRTVRRVATCRDAGRRLRSWRRRRHRQRSSGAADGAALDVSFPHSQCRRTWRRHECRFDWPRRRGLRRCSGVSRLRRGRVRCLCRQRRCDLLVAWAVGGTLSDAFRHAVASTLDPSERSRALGRRAERAERPIQRTVHRRQAADHRSAQDCACTATHHRAPVKQAACKNSLGVHPSSPRCRGQSACSDTTSGPVIHPWRRRFSG